MKFISSPKLLGATAAIAVMVSAGAANASVAITSFTESTFTVSGPGNNAFCSSGGTCDFLGGTSGNGAGSVNAPLLASTSSASGLPMLAPGSPTIIGQSGNVLQWWSQGNYNNTGGTSTVSAPTNTSLSNFNIASGTQQLFSDTSFFPTNGGGSNDTSTFLTALFKGSASVGAGSTLSFTGRVDDDVMIYYRTSGGSGAYTLLTVTPTELSNQPAFDFTSGLLGAGSYDFEIFFADRSST